MYLTKNKLLEYIIREVLFTPLNASVQVLRAPKNYFIPPERSSRFLHHDHEHQCKIIVVLTIIVFCICVLSQRIEGPVKLLVSYS